MKKGTIVLLVVVAVIVLLGGCSVKAYNKMVVMDENVGKAWANVETQYQRRADLIPNLVNTVKGYAAHESETLEGVIAARSRATQVTVNPDDLTPEKMQQFQCIMSRLISEALEDHTEKMGVEIGTQVSDQVIKEMDYLPNAIARSLRSSKTNLVAMIVPDISNMFFTEMARGLEEEIQKFSSNLVIASTNNSPERECDLIRVFLEKRLDGMVIAPTSTESNAISEIIRYGLPTVIVDRPLQNIDTTQILWPDKEMSYDLTKYLIDNGHRRIAIVNVTLNNSNGQARRDGYLKALEESGIEIDSRYISGSNFNSEQSYQFVKAVMSLDDRPTAVFCANNVMVEGALAALEELGLRIYDDVSVVGLGNMICNRYIHPRITSIQQDSRQMGREAGIAIGYRINDKESVSYRKFLPTPLEVNESVRRI